SALVQSRNFQKDERSIRSAIRFNTMDSVIALSVAFLVNAAIMVLAAMVFYGRESVTTAGGQVIKFGEGADWIRVAYLTLVPLLWFTSSRGRMGRWKNGRFLLAAGWTSAVAITAMDLYGLPESLKSAWRVIVGG